MADSFDPYHKWLGISPKDQPPHHYRLLALELFESDPDVIESAADQRMAHVRTFQAGQNSALSQQILNELSAAKLCLLNPQKKAEYDRQLRERLERQKAAAAASAGAVQGASAPRPVPKPAMPVAVPLPASPVVAPGVSSTGPSVRLRASRKTPPWRQPAVLGTAGAMVLFAAVAYWLSAGGTAKQDIIANQANDGGVSGRNPSSVQPAERRNNASPPAEATSASVAPPKSREPLAPKAATDDSGLDIIAAHWIVGNDTRSVTEAIRGLVNNNRLMMIVWSDLFQIPEQPDDGRGKKLRIRYRLRGNEYTVEYPDSYFVYLNGNPPAPPTQSPDGLEVLEARYGAGKTFVDVSAQARSYLRDGLLALNADQFAAETANELAKDGIHSGTHKGALGAISQCHRRAFRLRLEFAAVDP